MTGLSVAHRLPFATRAPRAARHGLAFLIAFSAVAVGLGAARALTTAYVPVLLDRIAHRPGLIGAVMLVNAAAGFAIPLVTGLWSDRRGRRAPFIAGGTAVAAGGLVAIALGTASSYLALALAAATTYVGLNAAATAHRTLVAERFADDDRPKATSAQELAMLVGALVATVAGGVLVDGSPALVFAAAAVVIALMAVPTLVLPLVRDGHHDRATERDDAVAGKRGDGHAARLLEAARTPGAREVLLAQLLWVFAYAALTPFMVLYAEDVLRIGTGAAGGLLAAFGLITGAGMLAAGRLAPRRVGPGLALGAALLGGGLVAAAPASSVATAALPFAAAALGAGLVTALGFPYFARFIPGGAAGTYSGTFFSVRAVAATLALPAAGGLVALTGSYRSLLLQGGAALLAVVPLLRARRFAAPLDDAAAPSRPPLHRVVAVVPVFRSAELEGVAAGALAHVDEVLLVDDGAPPPIAARAAALAAAEPRVTLLRRSANGGKGAALADAFALLVARADRPDAIVTLDSDGQHPPERIPAFLAAAAYADVVIGDRRDRRAGGMPPLRRAANSLVSAALSLVARRRLPDTQNGMRLLRTDTLARVPLHAGGFEAETRHLRALLRAGASVAWVPIPTAYAGEPSAFRAVRDSVRIGREVVRGAPRPARPGPPGPVPGWSALAVVVRDWWLRLALGVLAIVAIGLLLPTLQPVDERLYHEVNALGDGPRWVYDTLDPHSRNYALLTLLAIVGAGVTMRRVRYAAGAALAVVLAAFASDAVLEIGQILVDRPRPEETLGAAAQPIYGRDWSHIPSYPSGHLMVTAAMVAAVAAIVPRLRRALLVYLAAVAVTRITFGAHFPIDVAVGAVVGLEVGRFSVALIRAAALLPAAEPAAVAVAEPQAVGAAP